MEVNKELRKNVDDVISRVVQDIDPYNKTKQCLSSLNFNNGRKILVSIGKASWTMAKAVSDSLNIDYGAVITKYNHSKGEIKNIKVFEAGHPIVDENSIIASEYVLDITKDLNENDNVIFCVSGGGSALFEKPLISLVELQDINNQLIKSGADINEINTIRKRLSMIKGGRFALHCNGAHIYTIILSDVIGNDLSAIASGPTAIDKTTSEDALKIINKYHIDISKESEVLLQEDLPQNIENVEYHVIGSVEQLCDYTKNALENLNYKTEIIQNNCKDNVENIALRLSRLIDCSNHKCAYIIGGESSVEVKGKGLGGRNSELALLCSKYIDGLNNVSVFTFGSDGTDGPTDAAGGYVDGATYSQINVEEYLQDNDSYNGLKKTGGLIITGPTGSNINDVYVLLID